MSIKSGFLDGIKSISSSELARMHTNFDSYTPSIISKGISDNDSAECGVYNSGGSTWVAAAINQKMTDISNMDFYFTDKNNNRVEMKNVPDEIKAPIVAGFAGMGINQMLAITCAREDLCGNDLWIKDTNLSEYTNLYKVAGQFIIIEAGKWQIRKKIGDYGVDKYICNIGGLVKEYSPEQVIHHKRSNIIDPYIGIGLIAQQRLVVETEAVSAEYQLGFYEKDGSPNMVIVDKNMTDPDLARTKGQQFRENYRKGLYEQSVMYLYGDVSAQALNISAKDMDYVNNKIVNKDSIISIMESTASVLGLEKDSGNRAVSITATNNYYKKVNSKAQHLCDTINNQHVWLVDPKREYTFTYYPYATGDVEDTAKKVDSGLLTRDEGRIELGHEATNEKPMETIFINRGYAPINQVFEGIGQEQPVKKNYY